MTEREIRRAMYKKYPMTQKEKDGCRIEKIRLDNLRNYYKQRLIERAESYNTTAVRVDVLPESEKSDSGED